MKRVSLSKYVELALHRAEYEKGESVDCVVAEVPDLPGCLTQGRTFEEARDNLKEAIELWTAVCLSKGKVPPSIDGCTVAGALAKPLRKKAYAKAKAMRQFCLLLALLLLEAVGSNPARAQEGLVAERLIRLEEGQKALMQRLEDGDKNLNQRIEDLRADMNQRFAEVDKRFEGVDNRFADLNFWLQMTFGAVFATLGAVLLQWGTTLRRTTQLTTRLEAHLAETEKINC